MRCDRFDGKGGKAKEHVLSHARVAFSHPILLLDVDSNRWERPFAVGALPSTIRVFLTLESGNTFSFFLSFFPSWATRTRGAIDHVIHSRYKLAIDRKSGRFWREREYEFANM